MKKLFVPIAIVLVGLAGVSCVKQKIKINTDTTLNVAVDVEQSESNASDYIIGGDFGDDAVVTKNTEGEITVASPEPEAPVTVQTDEATLQAAPVPVPDIQVDVPLSKRFPKDDIFSALERPHLKVTVKNETGLPFKYTATVANKNGVKFNIEADIPPVAGEVMVIVSEKGEAVQGDPEGCVYARPIANFPEIFKGSPEKVVLSEGKMTALDVPKSGLAGSAQYAVEFSARSFFPFTVKKGRTFTMRREFDLSGVDFSQFIAITGLEAVVVVEHNLPLDMELELVEPENIFVTMPKIPAAANGAYKTMNLLVQASCPTGVVAFSKAVIDISATLKYGDFFKITDDDTSSIKLDIERDENNKQMLKVTGKLGD